MDALHSLLSRSVFGGLALLALVASPLPPDPDAAGDRSLSAVGERLFFDESLSADGQVACASCHRPELAFTDGRPTSTGVRGRVGSRNAPTLLDLSSVDAFFWDGRTDSLTAALTDAFFNPHEMGFEGVARLVDRLVESGRYPDLPIETGAAGHAQALDTVAQAILAFLEARGPGSSPFHRHARGERSSMSDAAMRGLAVFRGKARCAECHLLDGATPPLTDNLFHRAGVGLDRLQDRIPETIVRFVELSDEHGPGATIIGDRDIAELGRYLATRRPSDIGAFRTPTLRNVALTAPYMHDGSVATLAEAVDRELYYRSVSTGEPVSLTLQERSDLLAFLESLTDLPRKHEGPSHPDGE